MLSFTQARARLGGDAAHRAGAGCGIGDSPTLAEPRAKVNNDRLSGTDHKAGLVQDALIVYNRVRDQRPGG